jgi:hypothetical protein
MLGRANRKTKDAAGGAPHAQRGLIVTAGILILAFIAVGIYTWVTLSGSELSINGGIALVLGILGTIALGVGLMALLFFSSRYGYDEKVGGRKRD